MKPILSVINYNKTNTLPVMEGVEYISVQYSGNTPDIMMLTNLVRMASGQYVMVLKNGDVPVKGFLDKIMQNIGSNRDVILFKAVNSKEELYTYSIISKKYNIEKEGTLLNPCYFHPVRKNLIQNVLSQSGREGDAFIQYNNRMRRICFTECQIPEILMKSKNV